jgi:hypothetical protein
MERFVQFVVAGGIALVAGLWFVALASGQTSLRLLGVALAAGGTLGLAVGIRKELVWP